jgi:hydrogenase maturation protease
MDFPRTIVIGLGNPLLGDDGIGWKIAEQIADSFTLSSVIKPEVHVECLSLGGLSLMEHLIGYDRAILIDAIHVEGNEIGSVSTCCLDALPNPAKGHTSSAHDTTLQKALEMGRALGAHLPDDIQVVSVQAEILFDFSETLTDPVAAAVPLATETVLKLLQVGPKSSTIPIPAMFTEVNP